MNKSNETRAAWGPGIDRHAEPEDSERDSRLGDEGATAEPRERLTTDHVIVGHELRPTGGDNVGLFATEAITAGTLCIVFGGFVTPGPRFRELSDLRQHHSLQIGDDLFLVCDETMSDGDFVNHSCDPSLGFIGEISLVALRDIGAGEQLTFDYATCDSMPYDEFECECGAPGCRTKVMGEDWMNPAVQSKYAGHFSPYLQRRIDALPH